MSEYIGKDEATITTKVHVITCKFTFFTRLESCERRVELRGLFVHLLSYYLQPTPKAMGIYPVL